MPKVLDVLFLCEAVKAKSSTRRLGPASRSVASVACKSPTSFACTKAASSAPRHACESTTPVLSSSPSRTRPSLRERESRVPRNWTYRWIAAEMSSDVPWWMPVTRRSAEICSALCHCFKNNIPDNLSGFLYTTQSGQRE